MESETEMILACLATAASFRESQDQRVDTISFGLNYLKVALVQAFPFWESNKIKAKGRCFTVVSVTVECWHIKFRHVRCIQ